jgi:hypothetical protein
MEALRTDRHKRRSEQKEYLCPPGETKQYDNHVKLRITDLDTPVSPHSFPHMNPTFYADVSASFELESYC